MPVSRPGAGAKVGSLSVRVTMPCDTNRLREEVDTSKYPCKTEISVKEESHESGNNRNDLFCVGHLLFSICQSKADNWICAHTSASGCWWGPRLVLTWTEPL